MAQITVGLDLGSETVKRVRLRSSFRSVEVVDFAQVALAQDERPYPDRLAEALSRLGERDRPNDLVATALPGDEVSVRTLQLPFSDSKRIAQTIAFELEGLVPFDLEDLVFDHIQVGRSPQGGSRLLVALCQIDRMGRYLEALQAAGIDPRLVGHDCLAFGSLAEYLRPADSEESVAVVDIGARLTSLCMLGPDGVEFARTLSGGGRDASAALAEAFKVPLEKAELGKLREAFVESAGAPASSPELVMVSDAITRAYAPLVRELRQTLGAHRALVGREVSRIWLCGGGAAVRNLEAAWSEQLGRPVERLEVDRIDLPGIDRLSSAGAPGGWVKALGLALHAHQGGRRNWLNLRRGPFSFKGDFTYLRGKIINAVAALLVLALLAGGYGAVSYFSLRSTDRALDARITEATQAILGRTVDNLDVAMSIVREKISPEADPLPRVTAVDLLREIHSRMPAELKVRFKDVNISPKKIRIEGFSESFESVEQIKTALEAYDCFTEIQAGKVQKTKDDREVEFELTIVSKC